MCTCSDEMGTCEFRSSETRRARKVHRCVECRRVVTQGEQYVHHSMKWEGEVATHATCVDCDAWADALATAQRIVCGCSGWIIGEMWREVGEFTSEHLGYDDETGEPTRDGFDDELALYPERRPRPRTLAGLEVRP